MKKIVFVCSGNTCRSPMAEFIMKDLVQKANLTDAIAVSSAGCKAQDGKDMTDKTKAVLERHGVSFVKHHSRQFTAEIFAANDYVVGIDDENVTAILDIIDGNDMGKVHRLLEFSDPPHNVNDPFATKDYDKTYQDVLQGCNEWLSHIK